MKNQQIAQAFEEIADLLELKGENTFRIRAYRRAAQNVEALNKDLAALSEKELRSIPGIGEDLAAKIGEFLESGRMNALDRLKEELPAGVLEIMAIPGIGPKTAGRLLGELGIDSVNALETQAREGKLTGLPGIKEKTVQKILSGIELLKRGNERRPLGQVLPLAEELLEELSTVAGVKKLSVAGSLRRWRETTGDIDLLVSATNAQTVMDAFSHLPGVDRVLVKGSTKTSLVLDEGMQVDLRVVDQDSFGAALQYFTGSKNHNVRLRELAVRAGLKLNEYGIYRNNDGKKLGGAEEEDIYRELGLPFIPPELREDTGELEAAQARTLPTLITPGDIRGDLHVHSTWSDGSHTIEDLASAARERGYEYIAITDHSKGLGIAGGLGEEQLLEQGKEITAVNRKLKKFRVFHGVEMDIRGDGALDLPADLLGKLDFVIASIHSGFNQSEDKITARIIAAMHSPFVRLIAHPTGRLIGKRNPYPVDMDKVLQAAKETGTALEINAYPLRLDLNDRDAREAARQGVPIIISTDTHVSAQFDAIRYGVAVARRAWLEKSDVVNTRSLKRFEAWLRKGKNILKSR